MLNIHCILVTIIGVFLALSAKTANANPASTSDRPFQVTRYIIISDGDDTIASSHILGDAESVAGHFLNRHDGFFGVQYLFRAFAEKPNTESDIVSGMPGYLDEAFKALSGLLQDEGIPATIHMRPSTNQSTEDYKVDTMSELTTKIEAQTPSDEKIAFIFLGDNGEKDVNVFVKMKPFLEKLSLSTGRRIESHFFVHRIYVGGGFSDPEHRSLELAAGQESYLTYADIAARIHSLYPELINTDDLAKVLDNVELGLSSDDPETRGLVMPNWAQFSQQDMVKFETELRGLPPKFSKQGLRIINKMRKQTKNNVVLDTHIKGAGISCQGVFL